jgi:hypothetical protein
MFAQRGLKSAQHLSKQSHGEALSPQASLLRCSPLPRKRQSKERFIDNASRPGPRRDMVNK